MTSMTAFKQTLMIFESALYNQITNPGLMSIYNNEAILLYTINTDKKERKKTTQVKTK